MMKDSVVLNNGYELPKICLGTDIVPEEFFGPSNVKKYEKRIKRFINSVLAGDYSSYKRLIGIINCCNHAIDFGCTFFDTSRAYEGSERMLADALIKYTRSNYFICTKLCNNQQLKKIPARECLQDSMKRLSVDYVDLYLLHWPVEDSFLEYWKQLEELYEEGLVKSIGVSNCKIHHLEEIKTIANIMPMVDEVELHPLLSEKELRDYCKNNDIQIMAYTSTARLDFRLRNSKRLESVCKKHNKSLSQVILRWHIQNGIIPIFNTSTLGHLKENLDIFDFALSPDDMNIIDGININARTRYDSDNCEWERL